MQFSDFGLSEPLLRAVGDEGYDIPTPIQVMAIPHVLAGRDLLGCAQTGTGKTAAFALPILERLRQQGMPKGKRSLRVLVLSPTRELAAQIDTSFDVYGRHLDFSHAVVYGGVSQERQVRALARGVDVLVATPGRLLDLMDQGVVSLAGLSVFVLDEADRMLDMGFINDVRRIAGAMPKRRQTLLFSATMPDSIRSLARSLLSNPTEVAATPAATAAETVDQKVYFVEKSDKRRLLAWIMRDANIDRALVFARTKHGANRVAEHLEKSGISAAAIHGNKSQSARERALERFKQGELRALVATDIAARGIDIDRLSFVINYDLPNVPESYVHRIGRTGRAGAAGQALSFCEAEERPYLKHIERLIGMHLHAIRDQPYPSPLAVPAATPLTGKAPKAPEAKQPVHRAQPDAQRARNEGNRWRRRGPRAAQPAR
jgi:ATP-dependent RNA helicase RhlE